MSATAADVLQIVAGGALLMTIATAFVTLIVAVLGSAQFPAAGVKVKVITPLNPEGLKVLPDTPLPLQLPDMPL